jgi:hypothetical protein
MKLTDADYKVLQKGLKTINDDIYAIYEGKRKVNLYDLSMLTLDLKELLLNIKENE